VHTFGDFQRFNRHLHVIATDGCFANTVTFRLAPTTNAADVQELFRHEVFKMLKAEGKISDAVIENMLAWRHSGFTIYCGPTIWPDTPEAIEDLARYIVRAFPRNA
jgi:Putative transposase